MKAIVYNQYGLPEVLQIAEVETPVPTKNEILIKIKATAVNTADLRLRKADPFAVRLFFGLTKPKTKILGGVFSGIIETVGSEVKNFKPGDEVFGSSALSYGFGAYAEYKCLPETGLITLKPKGYSFEEVAVIPFGGLTALHFLKQADILPGQKILIIGASGSVGNAMLQICKFFGATVSVTCSSDKVKFMQDLGADKIYDYTIDELGKSDEKFDIIIDCIDKLPLKECLKRLEEKGKIILVSAGVTTMIKKLWLTMFSETKIISGIIKETNWNLDFLKQLLEIKKLKPVIDTTYSSKDIIKAHLHAEQGHKKGNIAIQVNF
ncbi:MAG TPA: NAD(P)-dependent alcohol dehydrogenase [Flavobacterium sp.]|nr:NAD(P)-dependent alcohol dehydrogenase [Flavobacterium sp.]